MIYFDTNKEAYQQKETIEKWGKTYLTECTEIEYQELQEGKLIWQNDEIVVNPDYDEQKLQEAKDSKYNEANNKAKEYLDGEALFEFEEGKHIEATDGNIGKFTAYALAYVTGQLQPTDTVVWNTKEDETVELNQEQVSLILTGLGQVQAYVWAVQYNVYVEAIKEATTVEEVEAIEIVYTSDLPEESVEDEI